MNGVRITPFCIEDYEEARSFWERTPGMGLSAADERERIAAFLERNPGLSFVARSDTGVLVGTILCGSDARRGYIYHLAVDPSRRRTGIGTALVDAGLSALAAVGIDKCHLMVIVGNELGASFWRDKGWTFREDILLFSKEL